MKIVFKIMVVTLLIFVPFSEVSYAKSPIPNRPEVWFYPLDNIHRDFLKGSVSPDYMQLFESDAPWQNTLAKLKVFVIGATVPLSMTPEDLRTIFSFVNQHHMMLALQTQGLEPRRDCGAGLEAYRPVTDVLTSLRRIKDAGGEVAYITLDEPLWFAYYYEGKNACHTPIPRIAEEIASRLKIARTIFPKLRIGDVEPVNIFRDKDRVATFQAWYDAFRAAAGEPFAYMQADVIWGKPWQSALSQISQLSDQNGLSFGVIYDGNNTTKDDKEWVGQALARSSQVEDLLHPDQVIFESWMIHPNRVLPESDATSFTGLIHSYLMERSKAK